MDLATAFRRLGISLLLGLLVGMQRERVDAPLAGVRTFALITLLGTLMAMLAQWAGPWVVVAGALGVAAASAMGNTRMEPSKFDPGITTEIAILLMYGVGAFLVFGPPEVAVVVGAGAAVLLHAKPVTHRFVKRLGETDMRAMMQFVLITLVILPVLPDRRYGPFEVFDPREIWLMVVLVVSISLGGYIALKLYGEKTGMVLGGIIGGLISSTATTVSYARRASGASSQVPAATLVIVLASAVVYPRVLIEIAVVARGAWMPIATPLLLLWGVSILVCVAVGWANRRLEAKIPPQANPTELKSALIFGFMYAGVLFAVAVAKRYLGERGIYAVAAVSGLTDMDAITLTTSRMTNDDALSPSTAGRVILLATVANLSFKTGLAGVLGGTQLFRRVAIAFGIQIAAGIAILLLWPSSAPGIP